MMRLNEVWQTDPAAGEWRGVTCDCMRLCGGEERVKRLESEQLRNPRHRVSQWPWHVTRGGLTDQGRCASTRRDQLLQPYYLDPHHMSPISDQLCLHHFCTDSGKTEFWGIMAMLPKCLLVTVTETPWHTPVMLMSASPSIVGPSPDLAWSPGQHLHWPLTPSVHTLQLVFAFYKFMAFFLGLLVLKTTNFPPFQNIALWIFE